MFLGWREEYCKMVVQLCSWIFELCSCIWKICVQWQLKVCPWKTAPTTPPPRIHRTLLTTPLLEIGLRNHSNYPPSNSPNVTTTPLLEIGLRNHSNNYPPLEFTERYDNPPLGNRPEKSLQLPPLEFTEHYRQPPSWKSAWEITPTTPPRIYTERGICAVEKILRINPCKQ